MKKSKKNILTLCLSILCITVVTFLSYFLKGIDNFYIKIAAKVCINLINGAIALISVKLTKIDFKIDFKNKYQYLTGAAIALILFTCIALIPALCGFSLIGDHTDFSLFILLHDFLFFMLVIGPVEELIFRVYLQDTFTSFFENHKWIGVVISAFLFGLFHLINGNIVQVIFTFGIGLVFGFSKYKIKNCGYIGVSFGHGLYDFLLTVARMFII